MSFTDSAWGRVEVTLRQTIDSPWGYKAATLFDPPAGGLADSDWGYKAVTLQSPPQPFGPEGSDWGYAVAVVVPAIVWEYTGVWKAITLHVH